MEENIREWWHSEKRTIIFTLSTALLSSLVGILSLDDFRFLLNSNSRIYHLLESIFVLVGIVVIFRKMFTSIKAVKKSEQIIRQYIRRNSNRKIYEGEYDDGPYRIVYGTVIQYYVTWLVIWFSWLISYLGAFIMESLGKNSHRIFDQCCDFVSSTAMFLLYLFLSCASVKTNSRNSSFGFNFWMGVVLWTLPLVAFLVFVNIQISEPFMQGDARSLNSLLLSMLSVISFVLVLGKLNSNYLQIPWLFMLFLYIYAIIQAYAPFEQFQPEDRLHSDYVVASQLISSIFPPIVLVGKLVLILTLTWISDRMRLVFMIIHKSAALDNTPIMLSELNRHPVEF